MKIPTKNYLKRSRKKKLKKKTKGMKLTRKIFIVKNLTNKPFIFTKQT